MSQHQKELPYYSQQKFSNKLWQSHKNNIDLLAALARDYELAPKGRYDPGLDEPFTGSILDIAKQVDLPESIILDLVQQTVISSPITCADVEFLQWYRLKLADGIGVGNKPKQKPRCPAPHADLNEPWKRWVYLRYLTNQISYDSEGRMINPEKRLFVRSLAKEVAFRFGEENLPELRQKIKGIRVTAYNDKRKAHEQSASPAEVALQRGIRQELLLAFTNP